MHIEDRPTLGVYGPAKGEPSGVADYSATLETELSNYFDCVHVSNAEYIPPDKFDLVLYQLGASARHHCAFSALAQRPGPAIIHEPNCLAYYYESWDLLTESTREAVLELFRRSFARSFSTLPEVMAFLRAHPDHDEWSVDVASDLLYLGNVSLALVHSTYVAERLRSRWSDRVLVIPQPVPPLSPSDGEQVRARLGLRPDQLLVGMFGFIGPYMRADKDLLPGGHGAASHQTRS